MKNILKNLKAELEDINNEFEKNSFSQSSLGIEYLKDNMNLYMKNGGKRIRPILFLLTYKLLSPATYTKRYNQLIKVASAIEIFHTWTLVHDDIIDQDDFRRGSPTVHKNISLWYERHFSKQKQNSTHFGQSMAILVGDLQQAWLWQLLTQASLQYNKETQKNLFEQTVKTYTQLLEGEAFDIELESYLLADVTDQDILKMIEQKSASLLSYCVELAYFLAKEDSNLKENTLVTLRSYALNLGRTFQIQDDCLAFFADEKKIGKSFANDLLRNKKTFFLTYTYKKINTEELEFFNSLQNKTSVSTQELENIRAILIKNNILDDIKKLAESYKSLALQSINDLLGDKSQLIELTNFCLNRNF